MKNTEISCNYMDEVEFDSCEEIKDLNVYKKIQNYKNISCSLISEVINLRCICNKLYIYINLYNVCPNSMVAIDILVYSKINGCLQYRGFKSVTVKIPPLEKCCCFAVIELEEVKFDLPKFCCKREIETKVIANYF
ncbi:MAG: hypothetical protein RSG52_07075 [Terrisporobacter sp.]|uniref:hypothetical protein n=1 Tax=Terrisporobacter sp. TaxID=1965305 RepID=UPI002FCA0910